MKALVNGVHLAYDDHGVGLPVIFLHAFPLHRGMWQGEIESLLREGHYRPVALDWRGFGESEIDVDLLSMELLAGDVAALMDLLGMEQAVLCGLSMGGYVAFAFLRRYPQRVRALVLADTRPEADSPEARAMREQVALLAETQGVEAIAELQIPRLLAEETRQRRPEVVAQVRRLIAAATPRGIAAASRGMALRADARDLLATITCPVLVMVGEHDALTTPAMARDYVARIPGAQLTVIPDAGHLSNLEQPQAFQESMRNFLRSAL
jgi:3-oxoadipate enol-lactonase